MWGVFYGIVLIIEKLFLLKYLEKAPGWLQHIYTMLVVIIAWVLFAFTDISFALNYLGMMFGGAASFINAEAFWFLRSNLVMMIICAIACTPIAKTKLNIFKRRGFEAAIPLAVLLALLACTAFIVDASYNPFLYFRF